jgi:hypothetical protein
MATGAPVAATFDPFKGLDAIADAAETARNAKPERKGRAPAAPKAPKQPKPTKEVKDALDILEPLKGVTFAEGVEAKVPKPRAPRKRTTAPKPAKDGQPAAKRAKTTSGDDKRKRDDEHRKVIAQLAAYGSNEVLGPHLTQKEAFDLSPKKLRGLTKKQAVDLLEDVEDTLANSSHQALADHAVREGMILVERALHDRSRFKVSGTTEHCFANQHWRFLLERAKIKYGIGLGNLDPVAELALVTVSTATLMHNKNVASTGTIDLSVVPSEANVASAPKQI